MSGKKNNLTKLYLSGEPSKNVLWFPNKTIDLSIFHSQFNFTFWAIDTQFWANSSREANSDNSQIAYITYNQNILNEFLIPPLALIIFLSVANDSSAVGIAGVTIAIRSDWCWRRSPLFFNNNSLGLLDKNKYRYIG